MGIRGAGDQIKRLSRGEESFILYKILEKGKAKNRGGSTCLIYGSILAVKIWWSISWEGVTEKGVIMKGIRGKSG